MECFQQALLEKVSWEVAGERLVAMEDKVVAPLQYFSAKDILKFADMVRTLGVMSLADELHLSARRSIKELRARLKEICKHIPVFAICRGTDWIVLLDGHGWIDNAINLLQSVVFDEKEKADAVPSDVAKHRMHIKTIIKEKMAEIIIDRVEEKLGEDGKALGVTMKEALDDKLDSVELEAEVFCCGDLLGYESEPDEDTRHTFSGSDDVGKEEGQRVEEVEEDEKARP